ncbi:MAG: glycosyltransferase [Actinobacteria bacterium]|nr:glycosyltransferase [Actinomycetota bacterium]
MGRAMQQLPRVSFLLPDFNAGGAETALLELLRRWPRDAVAPQLVVRSGGGPLADRFAATCADLVVLGTDRRTPKGIIDHARGIRAAAKALRAFHPSVVVSFLTPIWAYFAARVGAPSAHVVASIQSPIQLAVEDGSKRRPMRDAVLRHIDVLAPISPGLGAQLVEIGCDPSRVHVVPNGIDSSRFSTLPWSPDLEDPFLLVISRLSPEKDVATAIRAFAVADLSSYTLVIAGTGLEYDNLVSLADNLGVRDRVDFRGFVEAPEELLSRTCALVLTSKLEGFGNVIVEALMVGAPVVATDAPYGPSYILDGGSYGELCPVGDVTAIARAVKEFCSQMSAVDDIRARQQRGRLFSADAMVQRWFDLFTSLTR